MPPIEDLPAFLDLIQAQLRQAREKYILVRWVGEWQPLSYPDVSNARFYDSFEAALEALRLRVRVEAQSAKDAGEVPSEVINPNHYGVALATIPKDPPT